MQIRYTAKRSLNTADSPAHVVDTQYTMTVYLKSLDRSRKEFSSEVRSLTGYTQTTYQRGENHWKVKTVPLTGSDVLNMREFLDSIEAGATFSFDSDDGRGFVTYAKVGKGYAEQRAIQLGGGGASDYFVFGWTQREV